MTEHSLWRFSRAIHRAINEGQTDQLEEMLDDNVDWAIYGPIDMFAFLGARRGKQAVLEVIRQIAQAVSVHKFDRESVMLSERGVLADALLVTLTKASKPISVRFAHFARFGRGVSSACVP